MKIIIIGCIGILTITVSIILSGETKSNGPTEEIRNTAVSGSTRAEKSEESVISKNAKDQARFESKDLNQQTLTQADFDLLVQKLKLMDEDELKSEISHLTDVIASKDLITKSNTGTLTSNEKEILRTVMTQLTAAKAAQVSNLIAKLEAQSELSAESPN